ncbi:MAG: hypothetical protein R2692_01055 [Microbacterium sp.]
MRGALEWALTEATAADVAELTADLERATDPAFADEIASLRIAARDFPATGGSSSRC